MSRNYARFYILLNRLPTEDKGELKASLVSQYTGGRTESLREMTVNEYDAMCEDMQRMDAYCQNPRIAGKRFSRLTTEELDTVAIKLRIIQRKDREKNTDYSQLN